jgi:ribosomal protein L24E
MAQPNIRFTADKNGKPLAHRWSPRALRWIRISMDEAKILVAGVGA